MKTKWIIPCLYLYQGQAVAGRDKRVWVFRGGGGEKTRGV